MTDLNSVTSWIDGYVAAWNSNQPDDIGKLFAADAEYRTEPYREPWYGRDRIVRGWLEHADKPGDTIFHWFPISVSKDVAVIQGRTTYPDRVYSNLWVIRLDDEGRCREFTEWWMKHPPST